MIMPVSIMSCNIYTNLVSSIIFPVHEMLKGHTSVAVRREMEASQWWTPKRILEHQIQRLKRLLERAEEEVPYYRRLFAEHDFSASRVQGAEDLQRLPFLTKALIRANSHDLRSRRASGLARLNTGGSSGEPLVFYVGKERVSHDVAAKWRATRWWDVDIGDREIVVWGSPIELGAQDRLRSLRDSLLRTELLPAFEMSDTRLGEFIHIIRQRRPRMLFGYPSALSYIARYANENNVTLDNLGIRVAFVTSERLYDDQRAIISEVFGCHVANGYGGRDAGFIAHECPQGGMHITAEDLIVEVVDSDGSVLPAGEPGELVITHLATADFPFIRYRTGDVGILDDNSCRCGRGLPLLKEIQGRTTDFIFAQDGTAMHGLALIYVLRDLAGIREFKVIQENLDLVRVLLVKDSSYDHSAEITIRDGFRERLGDRVTINIEYLESTPKDASGKFRYIVSNVRQDELPHS